MLKVYVRRKYALDLGSSNTRLWEEGKGIVINEPTILAFSAVDGSLVAVGKEALEMLGKTPESLSSTLPVKLGAVTDLQSGVVYVRSLLNRVSPRFQPLGPDIMVTVFSGATQVERKAILDTVLNSGASHAYLVDTTLAASIGAGIPVSGSSGHMVVNLGSSITEAAILSLGGVVISETKRMGSDSIDNAIYEYLKKEHGLLIGAQIATNIKHKIGSAKETSKVEKMEVSGRDIVYGLPRTIAISSTEVSAVIESVLEEMIDPITSVLENIPPELASDIIEKGIVMTGGGANLKLLDKYLTDQTGIPAHVSEEPELCVVRGAAVVLENLELWKRSILTK